MVEQDFSHLWKFSHLCPTKVLMPAQRIFILITKQLDLRTNHFTGFGYLKRDNFVREKWRIFGKVTNIFPRRKFSPTVIFLDEKFSPTNIQNFEFEFELFDFLEFFDVDMEIIIENNWNLSLKKFFFSLANTRVKFLSGKCDKYLSRWRIFFPDENFPRRNYPP